MNIYKKIKKTIKDEGIKGFISKLISFINRKLLFSLPSKLFIILPDNLKLFFANKIKKFQSDNIDDVIHYSFYVLGELIRPIQIYEEFKKFLQVFKDKSPKTILEIGTANGGSLFSLCKLAPKDAIIVSIDLPEGKFGGGYPEWKTPIYKLFKKDEQQLFLLREDSHLEQTVTKIKEILNGKQIDFLFIDGDHSYEGVKKDFEMYSSLVKNDGIIAFHDIAPNGLEKFTGGVPRFWKEIKNKYVHKEFVENENQVGYGIGCLFLK